MSTDKLLLTLDRLPLCAGQPDDHFMCMILTKKGRITSNNGEVVAEMFTSSHLTENYLIQSNAHLALSIDQRYDLCITDGISVKRRM